MAAKSEAVTSPQDEAIDIAGQIAVQAPEQSQNAPEQAVVVISEEEAKAFIYMHESSNRLDAVNTSSGACGLGQRLPCQTLINECPDWKTNYACQDNHFTNYMLNRYGSWIGAYNFWQEHNWW